MGEEGSLIEAARSEDGRDGAGAHDQDAIGEADQLERVRRGDQHGGTRGAPLADEGVDVELRRDVNAARRVVEEKYLRRAGKGGGGEDLLLIGPAQLAAPL